MTELSIQTETAMFDLVQRQAKLLSCSTLVPKEFQGNMANCAIALNIAKRMGCDPFMVLQNIDIIHGRPSFRSTFLIAMVNASGRFSPLQFRLSGEGDSLACVAWAKSLVDGETIEGPSVSMAMARAEGWLTKAGSKWVTMPELMIRYRSASFFARLYAPDITLGLHTSDEAHDIPAEPRVVTARVTDVPSRIIRANVPEIEAIAPESSPAASSAMPDRATMIADLRTAYRAAGITTGPAAEAVAIALGHLAADAKISALTDSEMQALHSIRDKAFLTDSQP
jgi:hypothetical protein